ncbi:MAG: elongation factor 4 [Patescibacteria group bacterium]
MEVAPAEILRISGKTGEGVRELLEAVVERIPPPVRHMSNVKGQVPSRALIFDSLYDDHKGILAYVRVVDGEFKRGSEVNFLATGARCKLKEIGYFAPELKSTEKFAAGEIGYIATGLKEPALVKIGDTVISNQSRISFANIRELDSGRISDIALPGYKEPTPVVFISFYPDGTTEFDDLKRAIERLRLTDAALSFEPDANEALGRGLKLGFLGQLHFEITAARLTREFNLEFLTSFPSIAYRVKVSAGGGSASGGKDQGEWRTVKDAHEFPDSPEAVLQPMIRVEIFTPPNYLNPVLSLQNVFQLNVSEIKNVGDSVLIIGRMPLAELIRDFDDQLKSLSAGYASFNYELDDEEAAEVEKLEILVAGDIVSALTRVVFKKDLEREGRATVERLKGLLPRQQFAQSIQARTMGRIIAREDIPALRKDVTGYLYGGDRSRKMKLWRKQKRGKEKLKQMARVIISPETFREILKK